MVKNLVIRWRWPAERIECYDCGHTTTYWHWPVRIRRRPPESLMRIPAINPYVHEMLDLLKPMPSLLPSYISGLHTWVTDDVWSSSRLPSPYWSSGIEDDLNV